MRCELLAESKKHKAWPLLCQIPSMGPSRAAVLMGIVQTLYRFRTKRQMLSFSGLGIEMHSSADHKLVAGRLQRRKRSPSPSLKSKKFRLRTHTKVGTANRDTSTAQKRGKRLHRVSSSEC